MEFIHMNVCIYGSSFLNSYPVIFPLELQGEKASELDRRFTISKIRKIAGYHPNQFDEKHAGPDTNNAH